MALLPAAAQARIQKKYERDLTKATSSILRGKPFVIDVRVAVSPERINALSEAMRLKLLESVDETLLNLANEVSVVVTLDESIKDKPVVPVVESALRSRLSALLPPTRVSLDFKFVALSEPVVLPAQQAVAPVVNLPAIEIPEPPSLVAPAVIVGAGTVLAALFAANHVSNRLARVAPHLQEALNAVITLSRDLPGLLSEAVRISLGNRSSLTEKIPPNPVNVTVPVQVNVPTSTERAEPKTEDTSAVRRALFENPRALSFVVVRKIEKDTDLEKLTRFVRSLTPGETKHLADCLRAEDLSDLSALATLESKTTDAELREFEAQLLDETRLETIARESMEKIGELISDIPSEEIWEAVRKMEPSAKILFMSQVPRSKRESVLASLDGEDREELLVTLARRPPQASRELMLNIVNSLVYALMKTSTIGLLVNLAPRLQTLVHFEDYRQILDNIGAFLKSPQIKPLEAASRPKVIVARRRRQYHMRDSG